MLILTIESLLNMKPCLQPFRAQSQKQNLVEHQQFLGDWGYSSVGSVLALHVECPGFNPWHKRGWEEEEQKEVWEEQEREGGAGEGGSLTSTQQSRGCLGRRHLSLLPLPAFSRLTPTLCLTPYTPTLQPLLSPYIIS